MTERINVSSDLNRPREVVIEGTLVRGYLSPLDFPTQAIAEFDQASRRFTLTFSYPDPIGRPMEKVVQVDREGNVAIFAGENSGRLFKVEIVSVDVKDNIPNIVVRAVIHVRNKVKDNSGKAVRWFNYDMVKDFVEQNSEKLTAVAG